MSLSWSGRSDAREKSCSCLKFSCDCSARRLYHPRPTDKQEIQRRTIKPDFHVSNLTLLMSYSGNETEYFTIEFRPSQVPYCLKNYVTDYYYCYHYYYHHHHHFEMNVRGITCVRLLSALNLSDVTSKFTLFP
jgi:hypothetical protein